MIQRALLCLIVCSSCTVPLYPERPLRVRDAGEDPLPPPPACLELSPSELDFGEGTSPPQTRRVFVTNKSSVARVLSLRQRNSPFLTSIDRSPVFLPAGGEGLVDVTFDTKDALLHHELLDLNAGEDCSATLVLNGLGSGSLSFDPATTDFGFLEVGQSKTLEVRLNNTRREAVQVTRFELEGPGANAFSLPPTAPFELPPMSSKTFTVTATPPDDFLFAARLSATTQFGRSFGELRVASGAPIAEVSPLVIDVPIATFEPWVRLPSSVTRSIRVFNASTMGASTVSTLQIPRTFVELADGGAIGRSGDGSPEVEIVTDQFRALGPLQSTELPIRVTPNAVGTRSYRIHLFTNDPVTSEHVVSMTVNAMTLGRCFMRVLPGDLLLDTVVNGRSRGTISFVNQGQNRCVVDDPRINVPEYGLLDPVPQLVVEPWQTATLTVVGPAPGYAGRAVLRLHVLNSVDQPESILLHVLP